MRRAFFIVAALLSALACLWLAWMPLEVLFGKIPNPPLSQIMDIGVRFSLPTIVPGAALLAISVWFFKARQSTSAAFGLLIAAPLASFATLYLVFLR